MQAVWWLQAAEALLRCLTSERWQGLPCGRADSLAVNKALILCETLQLMILLCMDMQFKTLLGAIKSRCNMLAQGGVVNNKDVVGI